MHKQEFLDEIRKGLRGLPEADIEERLTFYSEMIDDRMEDGLTEEEAVAEIGDVETIVRQITSELPPVATPAGTPTKPTAKAKAKPKRSLHTWELVLIVLGSPVWFPLLIAAFSVVFALFAVVCSVMMAMWSVVLALGLYAVAGFVLVLGLAFQGNALQGLAMLGMGLMSAGFAILLFLGCKQLVKGFFRLVRKGFQGIKRLFVRGEESK